MSFLDAMLFKKYNDPLPYTPKPSLKPSTLGSPCIRKQVYQYLRIEPDYPFPVENIKDFEAGDAYHDMIKGWFRKANLLIDYRDESGKIPTNRHDGKPDPEFPVTAPDLLVNKGKIDGVFFWEGKLWLLEIKSKNSWKYKKIVEPERDHKIQGNFYCFVFEQNLAEGKYAHIKELEGQTEVAGVLFLYVNRDSPRDIKEFWATKDPAIFSNIVDRVLDVKAHVEEKKLPEKTPDFCDWCSYRDKCKRNYNPLK